MGAPSTGALTCTRATVTVPGPMGPLTVLCDVTCTLAAPRTAVIGLNGSGKSTLLRLFNGLIKATTGEVRTHGVDPATHTRRARSLVGFVFTDPATQILMPTPVEDIELSLRSRVKDSAQRTRQAMQWLDRMGLVERAHHSVFDLSGGERQLVALAAVLAAEPAVLVLDEPTTLLDLRNRLRLHHLLDTLPQQQLISTHDLDLAATAQEVLVMHAGRVVDRGHPQSTIERYQKWCREGFPTEPADVPPEAPR